MKKLLWTILPLVIAGCANNTPPQAAPRSYGPPSSFTGGPNTGMEHFSGTGAGFGPGSMNMKPAVPSGFKGY